MMKVVNPVERLLLIQIPLEGYQEPEQYRRPCALQAQMADYLKNRLRSQ